MMGGAGIEVHSVVERQEVLKLFLLVDRTKDEEDYEDR